MNKKFSKAMAISMVLAMSTSILTSCNIGGTVVEENDPNKKDIIVSVYNGGNGTAWINEFKNEWNAKNDSWEIILREEKLELSQILASIESGVDDTSPALYFSNSSTDLKSSINKGLFQDFSDILAMKPDGENGKTVQQKMMADEDFYNTWSAVASHDVTGGMYMLPWTEALQGLVYDHDRFLELGWLIEAQNTAEVKTALSTQGITYKEEGGKLLFVSATGATNYKANGVILNAGKDGKYGTYDDGQPQTEEEWYYMLDKIVNIDGKKAYVWTGKFPIYTEPLQYSLMAQYSGAQSVVDFFDKDSNGRTYEMQDGTMQAFDIDSGEKALSMKSVETAVSFYKDYIMASGYRHPDSDSPIDHGTAQKLFLLGHKNVSTNPESAMLIEGSWWENEARLTFASFDSTDPSRSYGKRDYRYMMWPNLVGGLGANGDGTGTAIAASEIGPIFAPKCNNAEKLEKIKDFLLFTLTEQKLARFTEMTGVMRPYEYTLTQENKNAMTPFAKTNAEIYQDKSNISIIRTMLYGTQAYSYVGGGIADIPLEINGRSYSNFVVAMKNNDLTVAQICEDIATYYSATEWDTIIATSRVQGYYKN